MYTLTHSRHHSKEMPYTAMEYNSFLRDDCSNPNTQSYQSDQGPGINLSAESSISPLPGNNSLHETLPRSSEGSNLIPDMAFAAHQNVPYTSPPRPHSLGDTGTVAGTSNPTGHYPYSANRHFLASLFSPSLKKNLQHWNLCSHWYTQDPVAPLQDSTALLQDGVFTSQNSAVPQEHSLSTDFELASQDGQFPYLLDPRGIGNYTATGLYSGSVSGVPTNQLCSMDGNQIPIGNYSPLINTGDSLSLGTPAGLQYDSVPLAHSVTVPPLNGDYSDVFSRSEEAISSNGRGDIFLSPIIKLFAESRPTTQQPTHHLDQQSLPTDNTTRTIQQNSPTAAQGASAEAEIQSVASKYPEGTHFAQPYVYTPGRRDKRKHNCKHEWKEARARTDAETAARPKGDRALLQQQREKQ
ncbi:hypothetical protein EDD21DRAFT_371907 [Dissophora ornata]|nr:hypothetical protein EDD21DRAFT_371907 [Dissophora ornata]